MHYIGKDAILRQKAIKVKDLADPALHRLAEDMIESMHYYSGVGLAANQIGSTKRICVIQMPDDEHPTVLVNLEVTRKEGEREVTEGCLSLPGWQAYVPRAEKVWARATGLDGKTIKFKGVEGLLAQALEHESDHLDGVLFIDHVRAKEDLYEVRQGEEEDGEGETRETSDERQTAGAEL
jgi:peptide deformylase